MKDEERNKILKSFKGAIREKAEEYLKEVVEGSEGQDEYGGIYEIALLAKETVDNLEEKKKEDEEDEDEDED